MANLGDLLEQMLSDRKKPEHDHVTFLHNYERKTGEQYASYRYRTRIPAEALGARINELTDDTSIVVSVKMRKENVDLFRKLQSRGVKVIVDFCDWYFDDRYANLFPLSFYDVMAREADAVTVPTVRMAELMVDAGYRKPTVICDPYDFPELPPHCDGNNLLWFGHCINRDGLLRVMPDVEKHPLTIVSRIDYKPLPMPPQTIPWTNDSMPGHLAKADIVIIPTTPEYKSANRAIESIRQGCFVVAEPHPAIEEIDHIWVGNIKEGVEWAIQNPKEARERTLLAQQLVKVKFSPQSQADVWRTLLKKLKSV